jgi:hypothetical protein
MIKGMVNKIILILALFMVGCNPIKKAERTVLNNLESSERVFRELEKTRPCANDTTIMTKYDTTLLVDTITNYQRDTITINGKEYITIKEAAKTIVKTVKVHQIHTGYIVDTRRVGILLDSVRFYKVNSQINKETSNKWMLRFWGLFGILIGYILIKRFLWSYLNILH